MQNLNNQMNQTNQMNQMNQMNDNKPIDKKKNGIRKYYSVI